MQHILCKTGIVKNEITKLKTNSKLLHPNYLT